MIETFPDIPALADAADDLAVEVVANHVLRQAITTEDVVAG
mgnify:CR=1 FL=1